MAFTTIINDTDDNAVDNYDSQRPRKVPDEY